MIESADEFLRLRTSEVAEEYRRAAEEEAPLAVWMDLIARFPNMREWVAHNKSVPIEVLTLLARDANPKVRCSVAMKRKLTEDLFGLLARDGDETVRATVAANKKVPASVLDRLRDDPSTFVRRTAGAPSA